MLAYITGVELDEWRVGDMWSQEKSVWQSHVPRKYTAAKERDNEYVPKLVRALCSKRSATPLWLAVRASLEMRQYS